MTVETLAHPEIVTREEWLAARKALLAKEKEHIRRYDALNAERRRLPMVRVAKDYVFEGPGGPVRLLDLFEGHHQLIVYHFMFGPDWDKGCPGCTGFVDALGDLSMLEDRDTSMVLVSRAPLPKLEAYKARRQWALPWVSSFDSDFNYDFHATLDPTVAPVEYNYKSQEELEAERGGPVQPTEAHGLSVFFRIGGDVFHTYSAFARGVERKTDAFALLDLTPYGRQEDFEDSPPGWPQRPTYG